MGVFWIRADLQLILKNRFFSCYLNNDSILQYYPLPYFHILMLFFNCLIDIQIWISQLIISCVAVQHTVLEKSKIPVEFYKMNGLMIHTKGITNSYVLCLCPVGPV